jgi:hypothetical protein
MPTIRSRVLVDCGLTWLCFAPPRGLCESSATFFPNPETSYVT